MNKTLTRTQIYIDTEDLEQAKKFAKSQKITLSQFIREAVKDKAKTIESQWVKPVIIPLNFGTNTPTDIASTHNDIYDQ